MQQYLDLMQHILDHGVEKEDVHDAFSTLFLPTEINPLDQRERIVSTTKLDKEQMVVLGQVVTGVNVEDLKVGMPVELVLETLHETDEDTKVTWKWQPTQD